MECDSVLGGEPRGTPGVQRQGPPKLGYPTHPGLGGSSRFSWDTQPQGHSSLGGQAPQCLGNEGGNLRVDAWDAGGVGCPQPAWGSIRPLCRKEGRAGEIPLGLTPCPGDTQSDHPGLSV